MKIFKYIFYWWIRKPLIEIYYRLFIIFPILLCRRSLINIPKGGSTLLVVVAFNNAELIQIQIRLFRKFIKENYVLLIADNSSDDKNSDLIYAKCIHEKVDDIKVPRQKMFKNSTSHAIALNWVYKKIIYNCKFDTVGFLDHDIFPIKDTFIAEKIKNKLAFGVLNYAMDINTKDIWSIRGTQDWYLWPGYAFFNVSCLKKLNVDFRPILLKNKHFDTGGRNWFNIYSKFPVDKFCFVSFISIKIGEGNSRQNNYVDVVDETWVHLINGSNWYNESEEQVSIKNKFDSYINYLKLENKHQINLDEIISFS